MYKKVPLDIVKAMLDEEPTYNGANFIRISKIEYDDHGTPSFSIYFFYNNEFYSIDIIQSIYDFENYISTFYECRIVDEIEIMFDQLTLKQFTKIVNTYPDYFFTGDSMGRLPE